MKTLPLVPFLCLAAAACATSDPPRPTVSPRTAHGRADTAPPVATEPAQPVPAPLATEPAQPRNFETFRVKVSGLTCPIRCTREVKEQLSAVPGVVQVLVDYDTREAIVTVTPGTDPEAVVAGLKAPYSGRLKQ